MIKKLYYYCAFILLLSACSQEKETITFETITTEKTVALSNDSIPPTCSVTIHLDQATTESGRAGEIINATVAKQLFNRGDDGLQQAAEAFAEQYTTNYVKTLLPLYNHDRQDSTKSTWYHYHYIINSHTQAGSPGTLVYLADINSREGNAHAISQQVIMNFDAASGRLLSAKDVFVDGFETLLKPILLEALQQKTGISTLDDLHARGYLKGTDIFVPENFILSCDAITFVYNPDEIAPYSLGSTELTISYTALEKILNATFEH